MLKVVMSVLSCMVLYSCQPKALSNEEMLRIVTQYGQKFKEASSIPDANKIAELYTNNAKYIMNHEPSVYGRDSIRLKWKEEFENGLRNVTLTPLTVDGTREVIYETGTGTTELRDLKADSIRFVFKYKYVNVWRLQPDGSYQLDIDTYNSVKK